MRRGSVDRVRLGSARCSVAQYRVWHGSVEDATWLSKGGAWLCKGAAWLSRVQRGSVERCSVAQLKVRRGSVQAVA